MKTAPKSCVWIHANMQAYLCTQMIAHKNCMISINYMPVNFIIKTLLGSLSFQTLKNVLRKND